MSQPKLITAATRCALLLLSLSLFLNLAIYAQDQTAEVNELKQKSLELIQQSKFIEALPVLEKLVTVAPQDAEANFFYGFALYASAVNLKDAAERKAVRVKARNVILKAKKLGFDDPLADTLIQAIPLDGSDVAKFSKNPDADKLMSEGEGAFTQGKMDEALKNYQKALEFDPKLYEAALFCGDVYVHKGDFAQAEVWYQKAIAIDPLRETGYRYSATPLMKQGKTDLARDRYIEAYISEPYNKLAVRGLTQWAEATRTQIAHPKIDIPTDVKFDEKGDAKINLDAGALLNGANDGSVAWIAYGASRADWRKEKFAKTFPNEKEYRHSLAEEADALRSVIAIATADKKVKTLSPSLAKLKKLNDEGLLEAYILLAQADEGIAKDFPDYLKQNRDKLRRYATEYILTGGGR